jgi:phage anti-repressor protein
MNKFPEIQVQNGNNVISARELHESLEVKTVFADWCKRMFEYGFEEGVDFISILGKSTGGRPSTDFALTLNTAKEIAMIQRSEIGKKIRQYFIDCEAKLRVAIPVMSIEEMIIAQAQSSLEAKRQMSALEKRVDQIEAKATTQPNYFTVMGYAVVTKIGMSMAGQLGKKAALLCKQYNYPIDKIYDPRFGQVGSYPEEILKQVFNIELAV